MKPTRKGRRERGSGAALVVEVVAHGEGDVVVGAVTLDVTNLQM